MENLQNEFISIKVDLLGAELASLKYADREYIYQKDSQYWQRCSPVLFPIVGRFKDGSYTFNNQNYTLPQHGFLRDRTFKLVQKTANSLTFNYTSTIEDSLNYPFEFSFSIIYTIHKTSLQISYVINNLSTTDNLYFNLGAHPAFIVSNSLNATFKFENQIVNQLNLSNGFITTQHDYSLDLVKFSREQIAKDALIFTNIKHKYVELYDQDEFVLKMSFEDFSDLGLWTPSEKAKFICIEPWEGHTDFEATTSPTDLLTKRNLVCVKPTKTQTFNFTIDLKL